MSLIHKHEVSNVLNALSISIFKKYDISLEREYENVVYMHELFDLAQLKIIIYKHNFLDIWYKKRQQLSVKRYFFSKNE